MDNTSVTGRRLAVLGYHQIGEPSLAGRDASHAVPVHVLHAQLGQLREAGWAFVDADSVVAALAGEKSLSAQAALVTFSGDYRSLIDHALPVLSEYECPGVAFVPTDHVDDWDDLRRLEESGIAVESHGASQRAFSDLDTDELRAEIAGSKAKLERKLGRTINLLAYPYGDAGADPDLTADLLEEAGYSAACLYGGGPFDPWQVDRYRLARSAIGAHTDIRAKLT